MARPPGYPGPSQGGGPVEDDIDRGVAAVAVGRRLADAGGFRGRDAAGRALDRHKAEPGRRRRQRRLRARAGAYTAAAIDYKIADSRPGAPRPPEEPMLAKTAAFPLFAPQPEDRRYAKECSSTSRSRWRPNQQKK